jgi:glycosyltransferase involved in cell wall biosynthesis
MEKKKLVIATDCFLPRWDGIARFLLEIIPHLSSEWEITVIAPDFPGKEVVFEHIDVVRLPLSMFKVGDYNIPKANKTIIDDIIQEADLIWVHTIATIGKKAIDSAKKHNIPVAFQIHSIDYELLARSIKAPHAIQDSLYFISKKYLISYYNKCDLIMSPSSNVDEMLEWNDVKTKKVNINLGINTNKFKPAKSKADAKKALNISVDAKVIGFCGRIAEEKSLETLFDAFKKIKLEYKDALLMIVGSGLKKYEKTLESDPRIIYTGEKEDVVPYLQATDIFVLPSLVETTSLATLEAMACEAVPIATPVGYVKEYIKEKRNGLLFPFQNATVLALKLKWLLKEDFVRKKLGEAARKTVQKQFS